MLQEQYKLIPGFSKYKASNFGKIIGLKRNKEKAVFKRKGYEYIIATNDEGKRIFVAVHRLIAMTFKPIENSEKYEVNHINKKRDDNRIENLEWMTHRDNVRYSRRRGLKVIFEDREEVYTHVSDFERKYGWCSGNVHKYIREFNGVSKKWGLKFELL